MWRLVSKWIHIFFFKFDFSEVSVYFYGNRAIFQVSILRLYARKVFSSFFGCATHTYAVTSGVIQYFFFYVKKMTSFRENFSSYLREKSSVGVKKYKKLSVKNTKSPWKSKKNLPWNYILDKKNSYRMREYEKVPIKNLEKILNLPFFADVFQFWVYFFCIQRFLNCWFKFLCLKIKRFLWKIWFFVREKLKLVREIFLTKSMWKFQFVREITLNAAVTDE